MEDGFLDPASGLLRNGVRAASQDELDEKEGTLAHLRMMELLAASPATLQLNAANVQAIHRYLFQDVYPWAGELRGWGSFQGQKDSGAAGDLQTMNFASYLTLPAHLDALGEQLAADMPQLRQASAEQFGHRAAYFFDQYNYAHGFREGNGRTLAVAFALLAKVSGQQVDFFSQPAKQYNQAREYAILRPTGEAATDLAPLRGFFARIMRPPLNAPAAAPELVPPLPPLPAFLVRVEAMREVQQTQERIWRGLLGRDAVLSREIREGTKQVVLADEYQPRRLAALQQGAEKLLAPGATNPGPATRQAASRLLRALPLLSVLVVAVAAPAQEPPAPRPTVKPTVEPPAKSPGRRPRLAP